MHKTYKVEGLSCCGCAKAVEEAIRKRAPGVTVDVNTAVGEVTVDGDFEDRVIEEAVVDAGFTFGGLL